MVFLPGNIRNIIRVISFGKDLAKISREEINSEKCIWGEGIYMLYWLVNSNT